MTQLNLDFLSFGSVIILAVPSDSSQYEIQLAILVGLLPIILAFSFIIFVIYRSRRESEFRRRETELKLSKAEGELKALRAQINPHFIFNCLNSIHHFIQAQEPKQAGEYLIKFSKLIRYVLESSANQWVSLEEELEANQIYLDLEKLRTSNSFSYEFSLEKGLNPEVIVIPPMLIQPFLENAVWHGLGKNGYIQITLSKANDNHLSCLIRDNGNGKAEKSEIDLSRIVKKSSMGLNLMEERFKTMNEMKGTQAGFTMRSNAGKEVEVIIPFEQD